jgi:predicted RNase H-like HicB family nuclease
LSVTVLPNKQLQRTVIRHRGDAASAPFHYALASRVQRQRAAAELRRSATVVSGVQCAPEHRSIMLVVAMQLSIESELEDDGRWLAEVPELPGVLAYGASRDEALSKAQVLALRVLAERIEYREGRPEAISISIAA